jgi:hypothetical protein
MTVSCNVACFDGSSILEATIGGTTGVIEISERLMMDYIFGEHLYRGHRLFPSLALLSLFSTTTTQQRHTSSALRLVRAAQADHGLVSSGH